MRRVVSRDGTSQYYLNNTRCRRKDITHILLGTGVGSHGYSIIEQGMISRLVEAKPEELRAFLEEAAGISKYKERRRETEHRIQHTRENLERLKDLREEIEKQLTHLQKQVEGRGELQEPQGRATQGQRRAARVALERAARAKSPSRSTRCARSRSRSRPRSRRNGPPKPRSRSCASSLPIATSVSTPCRAATTRSAPKSRASSSRCSIARTSFNARREDLQSTDSQIAEINAAHRERPGRARSARSAARRARAGARAGVRRCSAARSRTSSTPSKRWSRLAREWERISEELATAERSIEVEDTRLEQLAAQGQRLEKEQQKHLDERQALSFAEIEQRLEALVANEERLAAACDNAARALETVWTQIQQLREQEKRISTHLDQLRESCRPIAAGSRRSRRCKKPRSANRRSKSIAGCRRKRSTSGAVWHKISSSKPGWERAVETVLGPYLQAVGIKSIDKVAGSLSGAHRRRSDARSRPTAPPRSPLGRRHAARAHARRRRPSRRCSSEFALRSPSDEAIARRSELADGESFVTREGVWVGRRWLRMNRSDDPQVGVIARGDEIKRLRESTQTAARRADEVAKALADTRFQLERLEEARAQAQAETTRRQDLFADTKAKLGASRAELDQARNARRRSRSRDRGSHGEQQALRHAPSTRARRVARRPPAASDDLASRRAKGSSSSGASIKSA